MSSPETPKVNLQKHPSALLDAHEKRLMHPTRTENTDQFYNTDGHPGITDDIKKATYESISALALGRMLRETSTTETTEEQ